MLIETFLGSRSQKHHFGYKKFALATSVGFFFVYHNVIRAFVGVK